MKRIALFAIISIGYMGCGEDRAVDLVESQTSPLATAATQILVEASPNVRCTLFPDSNSSKGMPLEADGQGLVRFNFQSDGTVESVGYLDCPDPDGIVKRQALNRTDVLAAQPSLQARDAAVVNTWRIRPPQVGDPHSYSQDELHHAGFPSRPNEKQNPDQYAAWLKLVSGSAREAPVSLRPRAGSFHSATYSSNWTAGEIRQSGSPYVLTYGSWNVPAITQVRTTIAQESSLWVGLDGDGSADVVQDGTDQNAYCFYQNLTMYCYTAYEAWVEWYPASAVYISNFPIANGDLIEAESWVGDSAGNLNPNGGWGWYYMYDGRTNLYFETSVPKPTGTTFVGNVAEAVLEKPDRFSYLANFGTTSIQNFVAYKWQDSNSHNFSTDPIQAVILTQDGTSGSDVLATPQGITGGSVQFVWRNQY